MGLTSSSIDVEKERVLSLLPRELSVIAIQVEAYCDIVKGWLGYYSLIIEHTCFLISRKYENYFYIFFLILGIFIFL